MQSPTLPWEVIERAIGYCSGDGSTLCACALTCSQLRPRSLIILFTDAHIRTAVQLKKFQDIIGAKPHFLTVVRSLALPWNDRFPFPLIATLPSLYSLELVGTTMFKAARNPFRHSEQVAFRITSLSLCKISFFSSTEFLHFLLNIPNIEHITCQDINIHSVYLSMGDEDDIAHRRKRLKTLTILHNVEHEITNVLLFLFSTAKAQFDKTIPMEIPEHVRKDGQTSLTWWMSNETSRFESILNSLRALDVTAIKDITMVIWNRNIGTPHNQFRRPDSEKSKLCIELEEILCGFSSHRILLNTAGDSLLNTRKTISLLDTIPISPSKAWGLSQGIRYSGLLGHYSKVTTMAVSPDGRWVATASLDTTVILWDAHAACIAHEWFLHGEGDTVSHMAFSPDSRHLAYMSPTGYVTIMAISDSDSPPSCIASTPGCHTYNAKSCAWFNNGLYVALGMKVDGREKVLMHHWDGRVFQPLSLDFAPTTSSNTAIPSPDGSHWLIWQQDRCHVWDVASGASLVHPYAFRPFHHKPMAFNHASTLVAVGGYDGAICIWDMATAPQFWSPGGWREITSGAFSADDRMLLSISEYGHSMCLWEVHTGRLMHVLEGTVTHACFSLCGTYVASASYDTVKVWRTSDGVCLVTLSDHGSSEVNLVAFTPGGMLWSAADNGTVLGRRLLDIIPHGLET